MKFKVFVGALMWALSISALHVQLNVGWGSLGQRFKVMLGIERQELLVGFLPVT